MSLIGKFDDSIVEAFLRALRGRSLVLRKNLLTAKHTKSTKGKVLRSLLLANRLLFRIRFDICFTSNGVSESGGVELLDDCIPTV